MALALLLDECSSAERLVALLTAAGHAVVRVQDVNLRREPDHVVLAHAVENKRIVVTHNPGDFRILHNRNRNHHGILAIYQDNDPERDMTYGDIVRVINTLDTLVASGDLTMAGEFYVLNHWR